MNRAVYIDRKYNYLKPVVKNMHQLKEKDLQKHGGIFRDYLFLLALEKKINTRFANPTVNGVTDFLLDFELPGFAETFFIKCNHPSNHLVGSILFSTHNKFSIVQVEPADDCTTNFLVAVIQESSHMGYNSPFPDCVRLECINCTLNNFFLFRYDPSREGYYEFWRGDK
jgi:hypothetical protein